MAKDSAAEDHAGSLQFAEALIRALAGEGRLQGNFELAEQPRGQVLRAGLFYIEDVPTELPRDISAIKARVRGAVAKKHHARVQKSTSFTCIDEDIRAIYSSYLMVQPSNILMTVEGVLSHEDLQSGSPTPIWGSISFYRDQSGLRKGFEAQSNSTMSDVLSHALAQARSAIPKAGREAGLRATYLMNKCADQIRSKLK